MNETNTICKEHTGFEARIEHLENSVKTLWDKWDWLQKLFVGIFVGITLNLIAVIGILIKIL